MPNIYNPFAYLNLAANHRASASGKNRDDLLMLARLLLREVHKIPGPRLPS